MPNFKSSGDYKNGTSTEKLNKGCCTLLLHPMPLAWDYSKVKQFVRDQCESEEVKHGSMFIHKNDLHSESIWINFGSASICSLAHSKLQGIELNGKKVKVQFDTSKTTNFNQTKNTTKEEYNKNQNFNSFKKPYQNNNFDDYSANECASMPPPRMDSDLPGPSLETFGLNVGFLTSLDIQPPLTNKVSVANLDASLHESDVRELMGLAGQVLAVTPAHGDAIVEYDHPVEAVQAISMLHGQEFFGRTLVIKMYNQEPRPHLPPGLFAVGMGLGPAGKPLKSVRMTVEILPLKRRLEKAIEKLSGGTGSDDNFTPYGPQVGDYSNMPNFGPNTPNCGPNMPPFFMPNGPMPGPFMPISGPNMNMPGPPMSGPNMNMPGPPMPGPNMSMAGPPIPGPNMNMSGPPMPGPNMSMSGPPMPGPNMNMSGPPMPGPNMNMSGPLMPGPNMIMAGPPIPGLNMSMPGPSMPGPNMIMPGPPMSGPNMTMPGSNLPIPGPNIRMPGPNLPIPGPNIRMPGPKLPTPGPNIRMPGLNFPVPGPNKTMPGPNLPVPRPNMSMQRPNLPVPGSNISMPRPNLPLPGPNKNVHGPSSPVPEPKKNNDEPNLPVPGSKKSKHEPNWSIPEPKTSIHGSNSPLPESNKSVSKPHTPKVSEVKRSSPLPVPPPVAKQATLPVTPPVVRKASVSPPLHRTQREDINKNKSKWIPIEVARKPKHQPARPSSPEIARKPKHQPGRSSSPEIARKLKYQPARSSSPESDSPPRPKKEKPPVSKPVQHSRSNPERHEPQSTQRKRSDSSPETDVASADRGKNEAEDLTSGLLQLFTAKKNPALDVLQGFMDQVIGLSKTMSEMRGIVPKELSQEEPAKQTKEIEWTAKVPSKNPEAPSYSNTRRKENKRTYSDDDEGTGSRFKARRMDTEERIRSTDMLVITNLPPALSVQALSSKMRAVGPLKFAELTGQGRAIVRFQLQRDAERCIKLFHRTKVAEQIIEVAPF